MVAADPHRLTVDLPGRLVRVIGQFPDRGGLGDRHVVQATEGRDDHAGQHHRGEFHVGGGRPEGVVLLGRHPGQVGPVQRHVRQHRAQPQPEHGPEQGRRGPGVEPVGEIERDEHDRRGAHEGDQDGVRPGDQRREDERDHDEARPGQSEHRQQATPSGHRHGGQQEQHGEEDHRPRPGEVGELVVRLPVERRHPIDHHPLAGLDPGAVDGRGRVDLDLLALVLPVEQAHGERGADLAARRRRSLQAGAADLVDRQHFALGHGEAGDGELRHVLLDVGGEVGRPEQHQSDQGPDRQRDEDDDEDLRGASLPEPTLGGRGLGDGVAV
ncbi:hypothetical protein SDC9_95600 [bioreactor metagenome]|uniref:Uncharacterized protein n=1 Tax=bioreactor metagenome TaxID=1076179 RepID=A0A645ADF1_9ZZZZ